MLIWWNRTLVLKGLKEVPTQFCASVSCPKFSNMFLGPPGSLEFTNKWCYERPQVKESLLEAKPPPCIPDHLCCSFLTIDKQSSRSMEPSKSWVLFPPNWKVGVESASICEPRTLPLLQLFITPKLSFPVDWIWKRKLSSSKFSLEHCPF